MTHSIAQDDTNLKYFLNESNYLNSKLTEHDLKINRRVEKELRRMMNEVLMLEECIDQNEVYLAEYKLSPSTRAYYNKIKNVDFTLLTEETAGDVSQAVDANEIPKKILGLINKFHTDNKDDLDVVSGDENYRNILPQNIGKEPSILQRIVQKAKNIKGGSSNIAVKILASILANSLERVEKWYSTTKTNLIDAAKQGTLFSQIESQYLPSLKIAVRDPKTGEITYKTDTEGPGLLNWLKAFAQRNPKWTNFIIGTLINLVKIAATWYFGPLGGVIVGAIFGVVLRALVGRLKGESWGTAIKKAVIVTGLSILGGAITKGVFSMLKGGGFLMGFKSYFVGAPGADQVSDAAILNSNVKVSEADVSKLMVSARQGGDTTLLTIIRKNAALYKSFKDAAEESHFPDVKTYLSLSDRGDIADVINNAGGLPKNLLNISPSDATAVIAGKSMSQIGKGAVSGLKTISDDQLKLIYKQSGGFANLQDKLSTGNPEYYDKFLKPALEKSFPNDDPDRVLNYLVRSIAGRDPNPESLRNFAEILNSAGGLPPSLVGNVATQTATDATAAIAGKSMNQIGKAVLDGQVDSGTYMQSFVNKFGGVSYRTLLKAYQAGLISKEQFYSGTPIKFAASLAGDVPVAINGINVIKYLTKEEAASALAAYQMRQAMLQGAGQAIDPSITNIIGQLAKQAGEVVQQAVKESKYKQMMKNLI